MHVEHEIWVKNVIFELSAPRLGTYYDEPSSGVTGGGGGLQSVPQRPLTGKFLLTYREKRGKEKRGKWSRKEGKSKKGMVETT